MTVLLMGRILSRRGHPAVARWSARAARVARVRVSTGTATREVVTARNAVLATFFLNGFAFSTGLPDPVHPARPRPRAGPARAVPARRLHRLGRVPADR